MPESAKPHYPGDTARRTFLARIALAIYWPLLTTATHWPSLKLSDAPPPARTTPLSLLQGDKPMHLLTFALLALLLILARPIGRNRSPRINRFAATAIALGYAAIDEMTQAFSFERTVSTSDMLANAIGIVGILLLSMTPPHLVNPPGDPAVRSARRRFLGGLLGIFLGGAILAVSGTINRETFAVHFVGVAAITLALLRCAPLWPARPRLSVFAVCAGIAAALAAAEIIPAFAGFPFTHSEPYFGYIGLLLAMSLWSIRLAVLRPCEQDASPGDTRACDETPDTVPAPTSRA